MQKTLNGICILSFFLFLSIMSCFNIYLVYVLSFYQTPTVTCNGSSIAGLGASISYLAEHSGHTEFVGGNDTKLKAMVHQWLEYRVTEIDRCQGEKDTTTVLKVCHCYAIQEWVVFVSIAEHSGRTVFVGATTSC